MNKININYIISQLLGHDTSDNQTTPRSLIKFLLPIDRAFGFYTSNKVEFYDPIQDQIFYRNFDVSNESSRIESVDYINSRIDYYNRLCDDEFGEANDGTVKNDHIPLLLKWALKVQLAPPIVSYNEGPIPLSGRSLTKILDNKFLYNLSLKLENKVFVTAFNKMVYVYLNDLRSGKKLVPENTLHNPILEFEDWFMAFGINIDTADNLLNISLKNNITSTPVAFDIDLLNTSYNSNYSIRANPHNSKWHSSPAEAKVIKLIANGSLDNFVADCMFKNVKKLNVKKLSMKLNCSDKTAKKIISNQAPYLLDII